MLAAWKGYDPCACLVEGKGYNALVVTLELHRHAENGWQIPSSQLTVVADSDESVLIIQELHFADVTVVPRGRCAGLGRL